MNNLKWQSAELEWVEQVRHLLLELARASLADIPKLPDNLAQKALPPIEQGQAILDAASQNGISESKWDQYPELEFVTQVRQLLLELTKISLSERPRLPDNLSLRSLDLAEKAQEISETLEEAMNAPAAVSVPDAVPSNPSPGWLLEQLQTSLKAQQATSQNPNAPEWQQLMNMLDIAHSLYLRLKD
jgi:hypothetical protein